jgi:[acyl-carrier-protein] S-malonyltransferase
MLNTAFVFPGQGSQSIGMLSDFPSHQALVEKTCTEVSEHVGYDVWQLMQQGPEERLNQTEYTQVVVLTADVAVFRILQAVHRISPQSMAGHSLGEYAALVCAESLTLADAAVLVAKRGELMQQTVPMGQGAMAAIIGLDDVQVQVLCKQVSDEDLQVSPANYNAIGQVVIAGHAVAVEKAIQRANEIGARMAVAIPVSVPCHCPLLSEAATLFAHELEKTPFQVPRYPVISNVDLSLYESVDQIRTLLTQQLCAPVRWVETIQKIQERGIDQIVECGPGKVLSGLVKRIDKSLKAVSVYDELSLESWVSAQVSSRN